MKKFKAHYNNVDPSLPGSWVVSRTNPMWYCSGFTQNQADALVDLLNSYEDKIQELKDALSRRGNADQT